MRIFDVSHVAWTKYMHFSSPSGTSLREKEYYKILAVSTLDDRNIMVIILLCFYHEANMKGTLTPVLIIVILIKRLMSMEKLEIKCLNIYKLLCPCHAWYLVLLCRVDYIPSSEDDFQILAYGNNLVSFDVFFDVHTCFP